METPVTPGNQSSVYLVLPQTSDWHSGLTQVGHKTLNSQKSTLDFLGGTQDSSRRAREQRTPSSQVLRRSQELYILFISFIFNMHLALGAEVTRHLPGQLSAQEHPHWEQQLQAPETLLWRRSTSSDHHDRRGICTKLREFICIQTRNNMLQFSLLHGSPASTSAPPNLLASINTAASDQVIRMSTNRQAHRGN